jgi:cystine transport system permease protein
VPDWLLLMWQSLGPLLVGGIKFTVPLALLSFAAGLVLAFAAALARCSGLRRWWRWCAFTSG